jgi:N-acetylmuramoyl-L-alanine amidase
VTKSFLRLPRTSRLLISAGILGLVLCFWPVRTLRSDNFVFYLANGRQVLPLVVIQNVKYLPILQVLNLLGKVSGLQEKRNSLRVWFGKAQLEFRRDERRVRVDKLWIDLADPARISDGQWVVPIDFLTSIVPRLTHQAVECQLDANRIFIGDVRLSSFTVRLDQVPNGARLTVQFTDKVTVRTLARNGKWVMLLGDHAFEPLESSFRFQDPYVSELRFDDQDGVPKLILSPTTAGLNFYPVLAEGGKILLADVLKPPPVIAQQLPLPQQPPAVTPPAAQPSPSSGTGVTQEAPAAPLGPPLPVVVLDAGHGAEDTGVRSRDGVPEKDLVAQLVARVRLAVLSTRKYRIVLTRTGDVNPSFEQREVAANLADPAFFLTFHAGDLGTATPRLSVYTYPPSNPPPSGPPAQAGAEPSGGGPSLDLRAPEGGPPAPPSGVAQMLFVSWVKVQQAHLEQSRLLAQALQQQFAQLPGATADPPEEAPVRALRSVNAAAVAIEVGRLAPDADVGPLSSADFQQQVAAAITQALVAFPRGGS